MATCSSILARKISWTEEPGGRQPVELRRVRHDVATEHKFSMKVCRREENQINLRLEKILENIRPKL